MVHWAFSHCLVALGYYLLAERETGLLVQEEYLLPPRAGLGDRQMCCRGIKPAGPSCLQTGPQSLVCRWKSGWEALDKQQLTPLQQRPGMSHPLCWSYCSARGGAREKDMSGFIHTEHGY